VAEPKRKIFPGGHIEMMVQNKSQERQKVTLFDAGRVMHNPNSPWNKDNNWETEQLLICPTYWEIINYREMLLLLVTNPKMIGQVLIFVQGSRQDEALHHVGRWFIHGVDATGDQYKRRYNVVLDAYQQQRDIIGNVSEEFPLDCMTGIDFFIPGDTTIIIHFYPCEIKKPEPSQPAKRPSFWERLRKAREIKRELRKRGLLQKFSKLEASVGPGGIKFSNHEYQ
ncbi:MAG TPA: hypothetical protein VFV08_00725, partial [Puia sp.]|nr:hypothetical protein [Puia sp.]